MLFLETTENQMVRNFVAINGGKSAEKTKWSFCKTYGFDHLKHRFGRQRA